MTFAAVLIRLLTCSNVFNQLVVIQAVRFINITHNLQTFQPAWGVFRTCSKTPFPQSHR